MSYGLDWNSLITASALTGQDEGEAPASEDFRRVSREDWKARQGRLERAPQTRPDTP
jgi:hypothetical protein